MSIIEIIVNELKQLLAINADTNIWLSLNLDTIIGILALAIFVFALIVWAVLAFLAIKAILYGLGRSDKPWRR